MYLIHHYPRPLILSLSFHLIHHGRVCAAAAVNHVVAFPLTQPGLTQSGHHWAKQHPSHHWSCPRLACRMPLCLSAWMKQEDLCPHSAGVFPQEKRTTSLASTFLCGHSNTSENKRICRKAQGSTLSLSGNSSHCHPGNQEINGEALSCLVFIRQKQA